MRERPRQIPDDWLYEEIEDGRGIRWSDPKNRNNAVRMYNGDPSAERIVDRSPYVIVTVDGELIGSDGKKIGEQLYD